MTVVAEMLKKEERVETAKDMIRDNKPMSEIIRYSRLDESTILQLKKEIESE